MKTDRGDDEDYDGGVLQYGGGDGQKRRKTEHEQQRELQREKGRKRKVENIEYGMPLASVTLAHEQWSAEAQQTLHSSPKETRSANDAWNRFATRNENEPQFGFGQPHETPTFGSEAAHFARSGFGFNNNNHNNNDNNNNNNNYDDHDGNHVNHGRGSVGNGFFGAEINANHSFPNNVQNQQQQQHGQQTQHAAEEDGDSCSMDWEETPARCAVANCPDDFNHPYKEVNHFLKTLTMERINMSELRRSSRV